MFMLEAGWWVEKLVFPVNKDRMGLVGAFPANYVLCLEDKERNTYSDMVE